MADLDVMFTEWKDQGGSDLDWQKLNLIGACEAFMNVVCVQKEGEKDSTLSDQRTVIAASVKDQLSQDVADLKVTDEPANEALLFRQLQMGVNRWAWQLMHMDDGV